MFDPDACDVIYYAARGVPRLINVLCDTALVYGYADGAKKITAEIAREVVEDKADSIMFSNRKKLDALSKESNIGKVNTLSFDEGNVLIANYSAICSRVYKPRDSFSEIPSPSAKCARVKWGSSMHPAHE